MRVAQPQSFPPTLPDIAATRLERGAHGPWLGVGGAGEPQLRGNWTENRAVAFTLWHHGFVSVRGELDANGASGDPIAFYLPAGYRPVRTHYFLSEVYLPGEIIKARRRRYKVQTDGAVVLEDATLDRATLDNIVFAVR